jgi:hypothetical protein
MFFRTCVTQIAQALDIYRLAQPFFAHVASSYILAGKRIKQGLCFGHMAGAACQGAI